MSAPTQLNILLTDGTTTIVVPIQSAFATAQPGISAPDTVLGSIFKRGYFWNQAGTTAYPTTQIKSITYQ
jgi:hypothetical protein